MVHDVTLLEFAQSSSTHYGVSLCQREALCPLIDCPVCEPRVGVNPLHAVPYINHGISVPTAFAACEVQGPQPVLVA